MPYLVLVFANTVAYIEKEYKANTFYQLNTLSANVLSNHKTC